MSRCPPTFVPDPIPLSDSRLIQNPPAEVLAHFTVDAEGYIIDGPRSRPGEPVDHTALMTNDHIAESFAKVTLSSNEEFEIDYAHSDAKEFGDALKGKLWKYETDIGQQIIYRGGVITGDTYLALDDSVKTISQNTGLDISMLPHHESQESLAYIFVEDQVDMQEVADNFRNQAKEHPPETPTRYFYLTMANTFDSIVREDLASCFAFPTFAKDGTRGSTLVIFFLSIPSEQLQSCVYEETIQSMGLFSDDDSLFNTMFTDSFKEYLFPTELDWMMLRILYDERIENGMTRQQVMPVVRQILKETRPYGEQ